MLEDANCYKHKFGKLVKKNDKLDKQYKKILYYESKYLFKNKLHNNCLKVVLSKKRIYEIGLFCDVDLSKYLVGVGYYNYIFGPLFDQFKNRYPNVEYVLGVAYNESWD